MIRWRTLAVHHGAQERGRSEIFADYHLRIGEVSADTHLPAGHTLGHDRFDITVSGPTVATIVEVQASDQDWPGASLAHYTGAVGLADAECFASITTPDKMLVLAAWLSEAALVAWQASRPRPPAAVARHREVRIIRDYGMRDRHEAPQYYPPLR